MATPETGKLLTVDEVADRWGMSRAWVYQQIGGGRLPTVRLGRARRVRLADADAFVADRLDAAS